MNDVLFVLRRADMEFHFGEKKNTLKVLLNALAVVFLARAVVAIAVTIERAFNSNDLLKLLATENGLNGHSPEVFLLLVIVVAPVVEELSYRGLFTNNDRLIVLSISFFLVLSLTMIMRRFSLVIPYDNKVVMISGNFALAGVLYWILLPYKEALKKMLTKNFTVILHLSMFLFAALHLFNYDLKNIGSGQILFLPLVFLLYYSLSVALTYVRLRNGLGWSMGFHALYNCVPAILLVSADKASSITARFLALEW